MLDIGSIVSTYCFVGPPEALAQVVWSEVTSSSPGQVRVRAEGPLVASTIDWEGTVEAGVTARAELALVVPPGCLPGQRLALEVVAREESGTEVRREAELEVRQPGWTMYLVSHFHYDPVWWNTQAGYTSGWDELAWAQERRESFQHTGLVLVESHLERARLDPDYKFVLAEVDYLQPFWHLYPDRRQELRLLMAQGRLEIVGGTYNEPNTNLTGYETGARCAVYGAGFQRNVMGADPLTAWQLDVFGHDPSFPSLMAASGVTSSSWARGPFHQWGPKHHTGSTDWMQFPSEFEWLSPDGEGLLTSYMPDHYSAGWQLDQATNLEDAVQKTYELFCDLAAVSATKQTMLPVGTDYSPPNKWVTEVCRAWNTRYRWPHFVTGLPRDFFAAVRAEMAGSSRPLLPQTREMGPIYTGKDVSFIDTKQAQRMSEATLVEAEKLSVLASGLGFVAPLAALDKAWRQLVFNAHHDGITGSESDQVYLDLLGGWREAYELATSACSAAAGAIAAGTKPSALLAPGATMAQAVGVVVFNSLGQPRTDLVTATVALPADVEVGEGPVLTVVGPSGDRVPCAITFTATAGARAVTLQFRAVQVPALGFRRYWLQFGESDDFDGDDVAGEGAGWSRAEGAEIANEYFSVHADQARGGALDRVTDLGSGRQVLAPGRVGNELLVYAEHATHPVMAEGPWHLMPMGPPLGSSAKPANVHKEVSAIGQRLVITGEVDGTEYRQVVSAYRGVRRVDLRTELHGFKGEDRLVRLSFPTSMTGGTPLAEVGNAVVARNPGFPEGPSTEAPWTLDAPAQGWAGVGTTFSSVLVDKDVTLGRRAWGVVEIVLADDVATAVVAAARQLVVALAARGVTASCGLAGSNRYGGLLGDSNLPDTRITVGRPEESSFTAAVLAVGRPGLEASLRARLAAGEQCRLWVPPQGPLDEVWVPNADVRGTAALPVLVLAAPDEQTTVDLLERVAQEAGQGQLVVDAEEGAFDQERQAPGWTFAVLNRGTPGHVVTTGGDVQVSLLRSCTGWPSGVWIDPPRRTVPDGSNFELGHWSHVYEHALVSGDGDWRQLGCVAHAQAFGAPLWAQTCGADAVPAPGGPSAVVEGSFMSIVDPSGTDPSGSSGHVVLSALKPAGNALAEGRAGEQQPVPGSGTVEVTARLYESHGRPASVELRTGPQWSIEGAWAADLLERPTGEVDHGLDRVPLHFAAAQTRTVRLSLRPGLTATELLAGEPEPANNTSVGGAGDLPGPVFSRYWLHNKGPAPTGNYLLAVTTTPSVARVRRGGDGTPVTVTVSSGAVDQAQAGNLEIVVPTGWVPQPPSRLFNIAPGAFATVPVIVRPPPDARVGRYFVAARVRGAQGPVLEDVVTVDLLPAPAVGAGQPSTGVDGPRWEHPSSQVANELELSLASEVLALSPGEDGTVVLSIANRCRSEVRGEAQLVSPWETWALAGPWSQPFSVPALGCTEVSFRAHVPIGTGRLSSWLLVKVMYFGRLWYSPAVRLDIVEELWP